MHHLFTFALAASASLALAKTATTTCDHPPKVTPESSFVPREKCTMTTCTKLLNECGKDYGGCYKNCDGYFPPTFADPGCPSTSSGIITSEKPIPTDDDCPKSCEKSICADYINDCGKWYGGCFPICKGCTTPSFSTPPCPSTTPPPSSSSSVAASASDSCGQVCNDYFDDCGNTYGPGCYTSCPGDKEPKFTTPSCSKTETDKPTKTDKTTGKDKPTDTDKPASPTYKQGAKKVAKKIVQAIRKEKDDNGGK